MIAYIPMSVFSRIDILDIEYDADDYVRFRFFSGVENENPRVSMARIRYDREGEAYFLSHGVKWYLSQAIRQVA